MKYEKPVVKVIDVKEDIIVCSGEQHEGCWTWNNQIGQNCKSFTFKSAIRD